MQERRGGVLEGVAVRVAVAVGAEVEVGREVTEAVAVEAALVVRVGAPEVVLDSVTVALAVAVDDVAPVEEDSGEAVAVALAFAVLVEERVERDVPQAVPVGDAMEEPLLESAAVEDGGPVALLDTAALPVEVAMGVAVEEPGGLPELEGVAREADEGAPVELILTETERVAQAEIEPSADNVDVLAAVPVAVARAVSVTETDEWLVTVALPVGVPELVAVSRVPEEVAVEPPEVLDEDVGVALVVAHDDTEDVRDAVADAVGVATEEPLTVEDPVEDAVEEALALHVDIRVPTELTDVNGDAVEDADEVLWSVGREVALEVAEAVALEVGGGVAIPDPVEDALLERDVFDVPVEEAEGDGVALAVAVAVPEKLRIAVNEPVPVKDAEGEAVALAVADTVGETLVVQRSCTGSHALLTAQAGAPSSRVHAGPSATPPGHHVPPTPHPCGASTARCAMGANVNTDEAAHAAEETPWQVSDGASHWRPASHSVAERGPP